MYKRQGIGPGSYAGTRIAISAAIGLQNANRAKLVGIPSICAIQVDAPEYFVIGDARRQSFYSAQIRDHLYEKIDLWTFNEMCARLSDLPSNMPIFTSEKLPHFPQAKLVYPSALLLARLAESGKYAETATPLEPIYLREPHITTPKKSVPSTIFG